MIDGLKISITTGSLRRLEFLRQALPTWLARPEVDEVVLVDFGNEVPLWGSLDDLRDPRIVHVRAVDQKFWHHAKCHNLEFRMATGDLLLRLDNDYILHDDFFDRHNWRPGTFFAGNWRTVPPHLDDKRNLSGTLFVRRQDLFDVNGYNERLNHYGGEDDDVYQRLAGNGLSRIDVDISTMDHIAHSSVKRYENLEIASRLPDLLAGERDKPLWRGRPEGELEKSFLIELSDYVARSAPWTAADRMTTWAGQEIAADRWECWEHRKSSTGTSSEGDPPRSGPFPAFLITSRS